MKTTKHMYALYISVLILTVAFVFALASAPSPNKYGIILAKQETAILALTDKVDIIKKQNADYAAQLDKLTQRIADLQTKQNKSDRFGERGTKRIVEVTAYWEGSCGKAPGDPLYGITASGEYVQDGFIAAGPEYSIGTRLYIPYFDRIFVVMDRGEDITDGRLDVYMEDYASCMEFGRQILEVYTLD